MINRTCSFRTRQPSLLLGIPCLLQIEQGLAVKEDIRRRTTKIINLTRLFMEIIDTEFRPSQCYIYI